MERVDRKGTVEFHQGLVQSVLVAQAVAQIMVEQGIVSGNGYRSAEEGLCLVAVAQNILHYSHRIEGSNMDRVDYQSFLEPARRTLVVAYHREKVAQVEQCIQVVGLDPQYCEVGFFSLGDFAPRVKAFCLLEYLIDAEILAGDHRSISPAMMFTRRKAARPSGGAFGTVGLALLVLIPPPPLIGPSHQQ